MVETIDWWDKYIETQAADCYDEKAARVIRDLTRRAARLGMRWEPIPIH